MCCRIWILLSHLIKQEAIPICLYIALLLIAVSVRKDEIDNDKFVLYYSLCL